MRISDWSSDVCSSDLKTFHRLQELLVAAEMFGLRMEVRAQTAALEAALEAAARVGSLELVGVEVLRDDHVALHAHDLGDVRDPPRAVTHARDLDAEIDGVCDLGADRPDRKSTRMNSSP